MGFIASYKVLEKLCGEALDDERRLSAYIDIMTGISDGSHYVRGWDDDLKQLKRYRWIRNKIVHEPDCTEENMCKPGDALWLDNFYSRIMNRTDPLALYAKASRPHTKTARLYKTSDESPRGCSNFWIFLVFVLFFVGAVFILSRIM